MQNSLLLFLITIRYNPEAYIVGAAGYLIKVDIHLALGLGSLPASSIVCFSGIFILLGFWFMDRHWYHNLLLGAVQQGEFIEEKYKTDLPELGLSMKIRASSPTHLFGIKLRSNEKFHVFYGIMWVTLGALGVLLLFNKPDSKNVNKTECSMNVNLIMGKDTSSKKEQKIIALPNKKSRKLT